jgi:outer membrane autotransporter protein
LDLLLSKKSKTVGSGNQAGYDSNTTGFALGFDGITDDGITTGVSFSMSATDVDGLGTGKATNNIDSYTASLYMDKATDAGYIEGSITYGISENEASRKITSAGLSRSYKAAYDSDQISFKIGAGAPQEVGVGYLTPFGSLTGSFINTDAYTEKSSVADDALRLKVAQDDVSSMVGSIGFKFHAEMDNGGTPMISLAVNNEFGDNTIDSTNTFTGGGTAFKTSTAVEELSATLGLG